MAETNTTPMLELRGVHTGYGRIEVLKGIDLVAHRGEIVTIIGANGAGKSTTLLTISMVNQPWQGEVWFDGECINNTAPNKLPPRGLCHVPEGRRIFPRLTVRENMEMGAFFRNDSKAIRRDIEMGFDLFPVLSKRANQPGGTLSGGEQQMLAMARALMGRPKLLLLDEPSLGLAPLLIKKIFDIIQTVNAEQDVTIVLVEQNANLALSIADRGYVMETGEVVLTDKASNMLDNEAIQKAYLGE